MMKLQQMLIQKWFLRSFSHQKRLGEEYESPLPQWMTRRVSGLLHKTILVWQFGLYKQHNRLKLDKSQCEKQYRQRYRWRNNLWDMFQWMKKKLLLVYLHTKKYGGIIVKRNTLKQYDCCTIIEGGRVEDYRIQKKYNLGGFNDTYYRCKWICRP